MLRPQQKPLALLQELIARFSQPRDTVVHLFAGTFSTAAACATIPGGLFRVLCGVRSRRGLRGAGVVEPGAHGGAPDAGGQV